MPAKSARSAKSSVINSNERRLTEMARGEQLNLFEGLRTEPAAAPEPARERRVDVKAASNAELIDLLPQARMRESVAIVRQIARRRLVSGIPALAALCRRHAGFGRNRVIPEQVAAVKAMGIVGGNEASRSLAQLIVRGDIEGPNLKVALRVAVKLICPLPESLVMDLLRADNPGLRAAAARCVGRWPRCAPLLIQLLEDLHKDVRLAAACALGRIGNDAARPVLLNALSEQPSPEVVEAIAGIADRTGLVLLGRTAETRRDLAGLIKRVFEGIDDPLAAIIAKRIQP